MGFWEGFLEVLPLTWLWDTLSQHFVYIKDLHRNIDTLMIETNDLKRKREGFEEEVKAAESIGKKRLRRVDVWFKDVDRIATDIDNMKLELDQGTSNPFSRHKLGKRVVEKMKIVKNLEEKGDFDEVAESPRWSPFEKVPEQLQHQSSSAETLEKIAQALNDEGISIVCIYGMGGIGKTTLMKAIYNRFTEIGDFDQVIWVTVPKDLDLHVIQQKIGNKLEVKFHGKETVEEKRNRLYVRLSNIRYLLILDDLWQAFPLDQVGIPQPNKQNRCKIAISTRLNGVSNVMEVDSLINVNKLTREEAWSLFYSKAGNVVLLPNIKPLAERVVEECGRLPLAIETVGGSMRHKDKEELWEDALRALRAPAVLEVMGIERKVFHQLKLSYEYLEDRKVQSCFLYCSLYPEDYEISIRQLVRYWCFEEELIDNVNSLDQALKKGYGILERLKDACLLEGSEDIRYVRMHDLVRDLAIWVTSPSSSCSQAPKFLVHAGEGLEQPPEQNLWEGMRRISLMRNRITELPMKPNCPDLTSLFLGENYQLLTVHDSFFHLMPKLQILDLSYTGIKSLPSLSLLVNLRVLVATGCRNLQEIPPLEDLKKLQLLHLYGTRIDNLPQGIASMPKLKYLDLSHTNALARIPVSMISRLTSLVDLRLFGWTQMSMNTWREIATLQFLTCLTIQLPTLDDFSTRDLNHPMWSRLSRFLVQFGSKSGAYNISSFERTVRIYDCKDFPRQIKGLIENVESLLIEQCQGLESVSQMICDSKSLKCIWFREARGVKYIVDWTEMEENNALDCLEEMNLFSLSGLLKVFVGVPQTGFQQLRKISICKCSKLRYILSPGMVKHMTFLEMLRVEDCEEIEEIIEGPLLDNRNEESEEIVEIVEDLLAEEPLQRLARLHLRNLPRLTRICCQQLVLASMNHIQMADCPELKKLPILSSRIQEIRGEVRGDREWWEGIQWEDERSRSLYSIIYEEKKSLHLKERVDPSEAGLIARKEIEEKLRLKMQKKLQRETRKKQMNAQIQKQLKRWRDKKEKKTS